MKYRIIWKKSSLQELADCWLKAADRNAVVEHIHFLEQRLQQNPLSLGESRESDLSRVILWPPLGLYCEVIPDDWKVVIMSIWLMKS